MGRRRTPSFRFDRMVAEGWWWVEDNGQKPPGVTGSPETTKVKRGYANKKLQHLEYARILQSHPEFSFREGGC